MKMPENAVSSVNTVQMTLARVLQMKDRELKEWFGDDLAGIKAELAEMKRRGLLWLHTEGSMTDCPFTGFSLSVFKDKDENVLPCPVSTLVEEKSPALFVKFGSSYTSEAGFKNAENAIKWLEEHPIIDWVSGWTFRFKDDFEDRMIVDMHGNTPT